MLERGEPSTVQSLSISNKYRVPSSSASFVGKRCPVYSATNSPFLKVRRAYSPKPSPRPALPMRNICFCVSVIRHTIPCQLVGFNEDCGWKAGYNFPDGCARSYQSSNVDNPHFN